MEKRSNCGGGDEELKWRRGGIEVRRGVIVVEKRIN